MASLIVERASRWLVHRVHSQFRVVPETIQQLRQQAITQEEKGALALETLELIYQEKLFKLFVPEAFGGKLTSLPDSLNIFEQAAYIDGSFGWAVTIGSGGGFFHINRHANKPLAVFGIFHIAADRILSFGSRSVGKVVLRWRLAPGGWSAKQGSKPK